MKGNCAMKKLIVVILIVTLMLTLCACQENVINNKEHKIYETVTMTFSPNVDYTGEINKDNLDVIMSTMDYRMSIFMELEDYNIDVDYNTNQISVQILQNKLDKLTPNEVAERLSEVALLTFWEGMERNKETEPILTGADVKYATAIFNSLSNSFEVSIELNHVGGIKFAEATYELAKEQGVISIWIDNTLISAPMVNEQILGGVALISGGGDGFTMDEAKDLSDKINGGALPFSLEYEIV
jgi:preprotein translocase subunit SecD